MNKLDLSKVRYVIVHCTDTLPLLSYSVDDVRQWHLKRGFEDVGYHYLVKTDGTIELGRSLEYQGAHAALYNSRSIGVAYHGGRDSFGVNKDTRTFAQKLALCWVFKIIADYVPNPCALQIIGHNDVSTKMCPCFDAKFEYRDFYKKLLSF